MEAGNRDYLKFCLAGHYRHEQRKWCKHCRVFDRDDVDDVEKSLQEEIEEFRRQIEESPPVKKTLSMKSILQTALTVPLVLIASSLCCVLLVAASAACLWWLSLLVTNAIGLDTVSLQDWWRDDSPRLIAQVYSWAVISTTAIWPIWYLIKHRHSPWEKGPCAGCKGDKDFVDDCW